MEKRILSIIAGIFIVLLVSINAKPIEKPKTSPIIVLVESTTINGTQLTIVSIDKKEYLISSTGGIIKID